MVQALDVALYAATGEPDLPGRGARRGPLDRRRSARCRAEASATTRRMSRLRRGPYLGDSRRGRPRVPRALGRHRRPGVARPLARGRRLRREDLRRPGERRASSRPSRAEPLRPARVRSATRTCGRALANLLFRYTGEEPTGDWPNPRWRSLAIPEVAEKFSTASVLLADAERSLGAAAPDRGRAARRRPDPRPSSPRRCVSDPAPTSGSSCWIAAGRRARPTWTWSFRSSTARRRSSAPTAACSLPAFTPEELRKRMARLRRLRR